MASTVVDNKELTTTDEEKQQQQLPRLSDLQEEDTYDIIVDDETGERYAWVKIQGEKRRVPLDRPVRVYADGIYDCFHFGHARSLKQAKSLFYNTTLVVGVCGDDITHKLKGKTVMVETERYECVRHCKYADEVVEDAPWVVTTEFMEQHKIDFVSHGEDLSLDENGNDVYQHIKDMGKFLTIKRTEGISTSDLILRIVRDYEKYVRRNLSRGYTRQEMNVGLFKAQQIRLSHKLDSYLDKWKKASDKMMRNFVRTFRRGSSPSDDDEMLLDIDSPPHSPKQGGASPFDDNHSGRNRSIFPMFLFGVVTLTVFNVVQKL